MSTAASNTATVESVVARLKGTYGRWTRQTSITQMRADWEALFPAKGHAQAQAVDADGVACLWVCAPGARTDKVLVYFHGGGFQIGSTTSHQELMAALSAASGVRVLGVDYRMTPEHRYPAPVEDGLHVIRWLAQQGLSGPDLALAGDSAGGGVALATLLAMAQKNHPKAAAAVLLSAWTDMSISGESYDSRAGTDPLHQRGMMQALSRNYLGKDQDPTDPLASPLLAPPDWLRQLPPLLLQVGGREVLLSDSQDMAARVCAAGGQAQCQVWPEMSQVFQQFSAELPEAARAITEAGAFLATHLGVSAPTEKRHP
jgi:epsilon-lactone hydrolase